MSVDLVKRWLPYTDEGNYENYGNMEECSDGDYVEYQDYKLVSDHIKKLEVENEKLRKALDIYERERIRFKHAKPEFSGEFFIAGYHGFKNDNMLPQYVEICPAYGCAWVQVYERSHKTISYEGS